MIRIGVLGAGHLGKIHLKLLKEMPEVFTLVGVYDPSNYQHEFVTQELGLTLYESAEALLAEVDAIDIVTPTLSHYTLASQAIRLFKHVFVEKPVTATYEEARSLVELADEAGITAMVGHVERYNPAIRVLAGRTVHPSFLQIDRLAQYNPRGTDVSVVHDLMIHDIDLALHLVGSSIKRISANGARVVSSTADIATARLEFQNGAVAHLNTSRVAFDNRRRVQLYEPGGYYDLDLMGKLGTRYTLHASEHEATHGGSLKATYQLPDGPAYVRAETLPVAPSNAIAQELRDFAHAIATKTPPPVPLVQAADALRAVEEIVGKI